MGLRLGSMLVSLGVWFNFDMPGLNDMYPNSVGWVIAVLVCGGLIAIVAAYGYNTVAKFANYASPWMVLVFLAFFFIGLRQFIDATGTEVKSLSDVWTLANTSIWKGGEPLPGKIKFHIWHVMFFAWFCNGIYWRWCIISHQCCYDPFRRRFFPGDRSNSNVEIILSHSCRLVVSVFNSSVPPYSRARKKSI